MKTSLIEKTKQAVINFSNDEEGANTLEIIMILAIAAIVAIVIYAFGTKIVDWARGFVSNIIGKKQIDESV
jgi:hypothetical protein